MIKKIRNKNKSKLFFPEFIREKTEIEYDQDEIREMTKSVCKPCWELKYCPYGPLVESSPFHEIPRHLAIDHNEYLKKCLRTKKLGNGKALDKSLEKSFKNEVGNFNEKNYPESVEEDLIYMSCSYFGHLCPVFFSAESFTETEDFRNQSRNIPRPVLIRIVRRDDSTCQKCSKKLLDKDIEIDHIIPLSKGGATDEHNLRVLCSDCNKKKSNNPDTLLDERSKISTRIKYYKRK